MSKRAQRHQDWLERLADLSRDGRNEYGPLELVPQKTARRKVYGFTKPREDLCAFDAYGMDVIEGRA